VSQPNPWILFMGGIALVNVAFMANGLPVVAWLRYVAMGVCIALGLVAMALGLWKQFHKRAPREKFVPRRKRP
jgi:hypothetical protein